ncbi:MAG: hypothetical protein HYY10_00710 [Candidatus Liptonbacteria bacterium]|nr:hypothetical protein [Candidatus Liptonbacteria bacterium]
MKRVVGLIGFTAAIVLVMGMAPGVSASSGVCSNRDTELKTTDGWLLLGPSGGRVETFEQSADKKIYYLGSAYGGIYRSLDRGKSWQYYSYTTDNQILSRIQELKLINGTLFAATSADGIFVLEGDRWKNVLKAQASDIFTALGYDPQHRNILALNMDKGLLVSQEGKQWILLPSSNQGGANSALFVTQKGSILVGGGSGIAQSTDGGITWTKIFDKSTLSITEDEEGGIYVKTNDALYKKDAKEEIFIKLIGGLYSNGKNSVAYANGVLITPGGASDYIVSRDKGKTVV